MKKPTLFGKYLLLERINVGGMAEVFIAKAFGVEGFERILAIKKILPTMAEDEEFITMFIDEARISVQLNHANIVHIHELGKHDDTYFIAMEYVAGRDVRTILERYRRRKEIMPTAQAVFVASKLCDGLDYAHRKKDARGQDLHIIHRDVSPQNVLISYEGEVKVIDFGIAKAANRSQKTQAGILKGKFGYMSPEQVRGMPIDRRSDIFAVGVLLYEMLTGEKLFVGESDFSTLEKVRNADVPLPREFNPNIPPGLEKVVLKALAREPEDRYQWGSDLAEDLMRFLLAGDAIYSSKHLSSYMKEAFAEDLLREAEKMERFAGIERPDQIETSGVTIPPAAPSRPSAKRSPPPAVVVTGSPAGRAITGQAQQPPPGYIPPPTAEELEEMGVGAGDKTQIVDSTQTFMSPETRVAESSVLVDDSITGRSANPTAQGRDAEPSVRRGKSGPKSQVVIAPDDGEPYGGATMIGPAPTAPPSRSSEMDEPPEETTGNIDLPVNARSSARAPQRNGKAASQRAEPAYDDGQHDDGDYDTHDGSYDAGAYTDEPHGQDEVTGGSLTPAPAPKKGAKAAAAAKPVPAAKVKANKPKTSSGKPSLAQSLTSLPKPVLYGSAAGIAVVLLLLLVLALKGPSGEQVTFSVMPTEGATIEVNGQLVEPNMLLSLPVGEYQVVAKAPGFKAQQKIVTVVEGAPLAVSFSLAPVTDAATGEPPSRPTETANAGTQENPSGAKGAQGQTGTPSGQNPEPGTPVAENKPQNPPPSPGPDTEAKPPEAPVAVNKPPVEKPVEKPVEPPPAPEPRKLAAVFEGDDGAEIAVNGKRVGLTPDARMPNLEEGKTYQFTAKLAGYKTYSGKFVAKAKGEGDELTVSFALAKVEEVVRAEPTPPKPPPAPAPTPKSKATGTLACSTKPAGAEILVDGKKTGRQTPVTLGSPLVLPVGKRKISFRLNGKTTKPTVVVISEGKLEKLVNIAIE
ncbi:serine/threonine protein kinase [Myxococcus stipitatus DSM 14675]|uniref:Serine/threonine protein kinase n=1 Tax=Myxococcus stipitatus (strain DSM 14675 / JCM 12634 / Mx s8) TaxID=1278073 RepID=L7UEI4_MYXSD|nr:serine/threonine-protein kinase [Myxococcus stipitatus]AGC46443.1 serine/threonine protein kinase [Myxococcus stipitatus DSM 14675]